MTITYKTKIIETKTEVFVDENSIKMSRVINSKITTVTLPIDITVLKLKNLITIDNELFIIMADNEI